MIETYIYKYLALQLFHKRFRHVSVVIIQGAIQIHLTVKSIQMMNGIAETSASTGNKYSRIGLGDVTVNNMKQLKVICEDSKSSWESLKQEFNLDTSNSAPSNIEDANTTTSKFWKEVVESGELAKLC